ncbi:MAG: hypothetical protein ACI9TY_001289 [Alphaproteobacteria bacterium]|jgi:hypothetical protein
MVNIATSYPQQSPYFKAKIYNFKPAIAFSAIAACLAIILVTNISYKTPPLTLAEEADFVEIVDYMFLESVDGEIS